MIFSLSSPDEFLGASSPSRLDFVPPPPTVTVETSPLSSSEVAGSHGDATPDVTPSVSSDSVSLPTQLENLPGSCGQAPSEDEKKKKSSTAAPGAEEEGGRTEGAREQAARKEGAKEEGVQDLRVFELNSDSGKSTPSTNGKKGWRRSRVAGLPDSIPF